MVSFFSIYLCTSLVFVHSPGIIKAVPIEGKFQFWLAGSTSKVLGCPGIIKASISCPNLGFASR